MVVDDKTPELARSTKNVQSVLLVRANYLSVFHILNADVIIMTPKALAVVEQWLGKESK
jgi:ribosomal protein L4